MSELNLQVTEKTNPWSVFTMIKSGIEPLKQEFMKPSVTIIPDRVLQTRKQSGVCRISRVCKERVCPGADPGYVKRGGWRDPKGGAGG